MENLDENCNVEETGKVIVIEMMATLNIDGHYFIRNHQYVYLRTERIPVSEELSIGYNICDHHIALVEDKEYAIPEHYGAATTILKSEMQQDMMKWMELYHRDNVKDKTRRNLKELPLWDSEETYAAPFYSGEQEKQRMLKEAGEEDRQAVQVSSDKGESRSV